MYVRVYICALIYIHVCTSMEARVQDLSYMSLTHSHSQPAHLQLYPFIFITIYIHVINRRNGNNAYIPPDTLH